MKHRTVLITGGSRGLGRAMAIGLAEKGHRVAVTGRNDQLLADVERELPDGMAIRADVTDPGDVDRVAGRVFDAFGGVDVLVNNAGIGGDERGPQPLLEMDAANWWRVLETNLRGPMMYTKAVLPGMIERGQGVIVNIGSYIAIRPSPAVTAYATSKAALARFTDCLATEVADAGVQVFCVSPGLVLTDMTRGLPHINDIPASQFNQPEDIAGMVAELATGAYAALTGRFLHVRDDLDAVLRAGERLESDRLYQLSLHGGDGLIE